MKEIKGSTNKKCFQIELNLPEDMDYAVYVYIDAFNITQTSIHHIVVDDATEITFDEKIESINQVMQERKKNNS